MGVTLALLGREATGEGDALEVPLAAALCDALIYNSMDVPEVSQMGVGTAQALHCPSFVRSHT